MFKYIWDVVHGTWTQLRSLVMVFSHGFRKRDTLQYPEEPVYLPPRYRGRIVLTRDRAFHGTGATIVSSLDEALAAAGGVAEAMVIGGAEIYALARPLATRIELTRIHAASEGDTYFPEPEASLWVEVAREDHDADGEAPAHSFLSYARR